MEPPYLGKVTAAERAALPIPTSTSIPGLYLFSYCDEYLIILPRQSGNFPYSSSTFHCLVIFYMMMMMMTTFIAHGSIDLHAQRAEGDIDRKWTEALWSDVLLVLIRGTRQIVPQSDKKTKIQR